MKHVAGAVVKFISIDRIKHTYFNGLLKGLWVKLLKLLQYNWISVCLRYLLFWRDFKNYFYFLLWKNSNIKEDRIVNETSFIHPWTPTTSPWPILPIPHPHKCFIMYLANCKYSFAKHNHNTLNQIFPQHI